MRILGAIPARLSSTRLPNKVLEKLGEKTILRLVYDVVVSSQLFDKVVIATDSKLIAKSVSDFGGDVVMTSVEHSCGSERLGELLPLYPDFDVIVNIQADQPFLTHSILEDLIRPYRQGEIIPMLTLAAPLNSDKEWKDVNVVKVVLDINQEALYFSRSPIPYKREAVSILPVYKHLGLYAFTRDFLQIYLQLENTPLGISESLEQLRVLEHGYPIKVNITSGSAMEINSPEDLAQAKKLIK